MARFSLASTALLCWASLAAAATSASAASGPRASPSTTPMNGVLTSQGCFGSLPETAKLQNDVSFMSSGACYETCKGDDSYTVMILHEDSCYCATTYPPKSSIVDDSKCNSPCAGYAKDACGGENAYSVFNTGEKLKVDYDTDSSTALATASATSSTGSLDSASSDSATSTSAASKASSAASGTAADSTQATSTPSSTAAGENSGVIQKPSLVHVLAWLGVALAAL